VGVAIWKSGSGADGKLWIFFHEN